MLIKSLYYIKNEKLWNFIYGSFKADFHSVRNVVRSIFSGRFLLKCVNSTTANEICSAWLFVIQKKALAKSRSHYILHWMEIRLYAHYARLYTIKIHPCLMNKWPIWQYLVWDGAHGLVFHRALKIARKRDKDIVSHPNMKIVLAFRLMEYKQNLHRVPRSNVMVC